MKCRECDYIINEFEEVFMGMDRSFCSESCRHHYIKLLKERCIFNVNRCASDYIFGHKSKHEFDFQDRSKLACEIISSVPTERLRVDVKKRARCFNII